MCKSILLFLSIFLLSVSILYAAGDIDTLTFTTYYPSPYGSYNEMRVNKLSVGSTYHDYSTIPIPDNSLIIEGSVGIGTISPAARTGLHLVNKGAIRIEGTSPAYQLAENSDPPDPSDPVDQNYQIRIQSGKLRFDTQLDGFPSGSASTKVTFDNAGNVGIGTANPQAKLEIDSNSSGFLPPRMNESDKTSISNPPEGSIIYNKSNNQLEFFNGSSWKSVSGASSGFSYTYYCAKDATWGSPVCTDAGGTQKHCPAGSRQVKNLGPWGWCDDRLGPTGVHSLDIYVEYPRMPGYTCIESDAHNMNVGNAYVCVEDS